MIRFFVIVVSAVFFLCLASLDVFAQSRSKVTLSPPDWSVKLQTLNTGGSAPTLNSEEYILVDALKKDFAAGRYSRAYQFMLENWPDKPSAALLYIRAQTAVQLKKYQAAVSDYKASVKQHGPYLLAAQSLANVAFLQGDEVRARQYLTEAIALGANSDIIYGQLAYLNLRHHSAFSAVSAYQKAYALAPEKSQWQQGLLIALNRAGAHYQARALVDELLESDGSNRQLWLHRANAALGVEDELGALTAMEAALRLGEKGSQNVLLTSKLNLAQGNVARAVALMLSNLSLVRRFPEVSPLLNWLASRNRWEQHQKLLAAALKQQSHYRPDQRSELYVQYARLAMHRNNEAKAEQHLDHALALSPANGQALLLLADMLAQQGNLSRADMLLSRAQALTDYQERALLRRAQLAYQRKHYSAAHDLLQQVLSVNPLRRDLIPNMEVLMHLARES